MGVADATHAADAMDAADKVEAVHVVDELQRLCGERRAESNLLHLVRSDVVLLPNQDWNAVAKNPGFFRAPRARRSPYGGGEAWS
jgi:hypothetical protein